MEVGGGRRINGGAEEDDGENDVNGDLDAWERTYTDERSWEALEEDESGLLCPIDDKALYHSQYRRRLRSLSSTATSARKQKGLIRYLFVVIDLSRLQRWIFDRVELLSLQNMLRLSSGSFLPESS